MKRDLHESVLLNEAVEALAITPAGWYIDGTYGRGGHTRAILAQLGTQGRVLAIDKDQTAVESAKQEWRDEPRLDVVQGSFARLREFASQQGMLGHAAGILLDLGVSSPQLEDPTRGFSFQLDGPLDMRMDQTTGKSAALFLAETDEQTLIDVLKNYGEERFARRIARAIIAERRETPITRTQQLVEIVTRAVPKREPHKNPATRTFQALRICVNEELSDLAQVLAQAVDVLKPGGRLVVISFHSLEDRIVKEFMRGQKLSEVLPREIPITEDKELKPIRAISKAIKPSEAEIAHNPRSRSAIMRIAEKL
jgi:16S rRNA (cytosine1402-N4)-methyltransferase